MDFYDIIKDRRALLNIIQQDLLDMGPFIIILYSSFTQLFGQLFDKFKTNGIIINKK